MIDPDLIRKHFASLSLHLSERERRLFAAAEARSAGYGGVAATPSRLDVLQDGRFERVGGGNHADIGRPIRARLMVVDGLISEPGDTY